MKTIVRICEVTLILLGVALLTVYVFFRMHAWFFQAYDSWSFDQALKHRSSRLNRHLPRRSPTITHDSAKEHAEESADFPDWAPDRLLAHLKSFGRQPGSIVGKLLIPELNLSVMILEGTDRWTLNRAVGHIEGTALPGKTGNVGVSAHRDGFFRNLGRIRPGDEISIVTASETYTYEVEGTKIVNPSDTEVLEPSAKPTLTLVTCFPFYFVGAAPQRFIVHADLVH